MPFALSDNHIEQFQALYQKRFGKSISKGEALDKGLSLVRLLEMIFRGSATITAPDDDGPKITSP